MPPMYSFRLSDALRALALPLAAVTIAACSGSPAAPSGRTTFGSDGSGAIIEGTVTPGASPPGARTTSASAAPAAASPMSGLTVRVIGSDLTVQVDATGFFRLERVPAGTVRLRFQHDDVDATAELPNVAGDQIIRVAFQVSGTQAVIVDEVREGKVTLCHAEGNGSYHAITISESAEPAHRAHGDGEVGEEVPGRTPMIFGEDCALEGPAVRIEKSTNGEDADSAPGPSIAAGQPVTWEYRVWNTGTVPLTGIEVDDDRGVVVSCNGQTTLAVDASMTCQGTGSAALGQYRNEGTVTAAWTFNGESGTISDSDPSHYLGVAPDGGSGEPGKVTLCHRTGAGFFVKIDVARAAEPAHRAHGDGAPGEAVPGEPAKVFTASCGVD